MKRHKLLSVILSVAMIASLAATAVPVSAATTDGDRFLVGDVDLNGVININDYGEAVYSVQIPRLAYGAIISNGECESTSVIYDFIPAGGAYYLRSDFTSIDEFGIKRYDPIPF